MAQDIAVVGLNSSPSPGLEPPDQKEPDFVSSVSFNLTGKSGGRLGGSGPCRMCFSSGKLSLFRDGFGLKSPGRMCFSSGKLSLFHDGFGLNSPGRWDPEGRELPTSSAWLLIRSSMWTAILDSKGSALNVQYSVSPWQRRASSGCL